ncbi:hypothetical protein WCLE_009240 [Wolbachia endosymbiont of Cimex lectularius]|nr:hypothetical protein WCLE_009240 [Wolbachia endosymbiont of Cimex lectularius]
MNELAKSGVYTIPSSAEQVSILAQATLTMD